MTFNPRQGVGMDSHVGIDENEEIPLRFARPEIACGGGPMRAPG